MKYFSVIIPAFNASSFITRSLDSVINQSFSDFDIIVVNDGSTDDTSKILYKYQKYSNIQIITQKNQGIASARNTGISNSTGRYLAFLDADDYWYKNKLEAVHKIIEKNALYTIFYHDEIEKKYDKITKSNYRTINNNNAYLDLLFGGNALSTSATIVISKVLKSIGGFDENLHYNSVEDYDLWMRIAQKGFLFYKINQVLGEYNRVDNSISQKILYHQVNKINVLKKHFNHIEYAFLRKKKRLSQEYYISGRYLNKISDKKSNSYLLKSLKEYFFNVKSMLIIINNILKRNF